MKLRIAIFSFIILLPSLLISQKEDHIWLFGSLYADNYNEDWKNDTLWGNSTIDFNYDPPKIYYDSCLWLDFWGANSSIADENGDLLFYSNGQVLVNNNHEYIEDTINYSTGWRANAFVEDNIVIPAGLPFQQSIISIPVPDKVDMYYVIYTAFEEIENYQYLWRYSTLKYSEDEEWEMVVKDKVLLQDSLAASGLTTCMHANGRDHWMVLPNYRTTKLHTYLITSDSIILHPNQDMAIEYDGATGMKSFSPDGRYYAINDAYRFNEDNVLSIYDFNRATGKISNPRIDRFPTITFGNGIAFSPDSKKLYATNDSFLYQYDMEAEDIIASRQTIGIYDGFLSMIPGFPDIPTRFGFPALAPDGKVYISVGAGSSKYLHVIHNPNALGKACNLTQHSIKLPTSYARTIPNFPHFRLGPIDGSAADTLGIDNHPVAKYRVVQDSFDYLTLDFMDLSYYAPTHWEWDFGDGIGNSMEQYPRYSYDGPGVYEACLTVSNENSEDTYCKTLNLGTVDVEEIETVVDIHVFPNPVVDDYTIISIYDYLPRDARAIIYTLDGQKIKEITLNGRQSQVDMSFLESGVYLISVYDGAVLLGTQKVSKM